MYQSSSLGSRGGKHTSSQVPGAKRCKEREASPARGGWGWTGSAEAETRLVSGALRGTDDMWDEHSISGASGIPRGNLGRVPQTSGRLDDITRICAYLSAGARALRAGTTGSRGRCGRRLTLATGAFAASSFHQQKVPVSPHPPSRLCCRTEQI